MDYGNLGWFPFSTKKQVTIYLIFNLIILIVVVKNITRFCFVYIFTIIIKIGFALKIIIRKEKDE